MGLLCMLGRHSVVSRGIRNDDREFGRCDRCRRDLMLKGDRWTAVPRDFRIVWRPRTGDALADEMAGAAAVGREVNVRGVVVGERAFGSQRFALVRLNAEDERSYRGAVDRLGTSGSVSAQMDDRGRMGLFGPLEPLLDRARAVSTQKSGEMFDWEHKHAGPEAKRSQVRIPQLSKPAS